MDTVPEPLLRNTELLLREGAALWQHERNLRPQQAVHYPGEQLVVDHGEDDI